MRLAKRLLAALAWLMLGSFLTYVAYLMLSDIPDKSELITVNSADIVDVKYGHYYRKGRKLPQLCFNTREWDCISVRDEAAGFKELEQAVEHRIPYSIGFAQTSELFSDSNRRYNMVYAVDVNGRSVESFDAHVLEARVYGSAVFGLGLAALGLAIRALRNCLRTES